MAFIKFLIIVFGTYYFLKLMIRLLFPFLINRTYNKMQNYQNQQNANSRPEGEVTVQNDAAQKETPNKDNFGEYVDYEEVN